jgi:cyclase
MLKKRIIPCLDIDNGNVVKGVFFKNTKNIGNPVDLAKFYSRNGADELCLLDITATIDSRDAIYKIIHDVSVECSIPFCVGGGIKDINDASKIIMNGADKVSVGSAAVLNPKIINDIANKFGSQCVVVSIDAKKDKDGSYYVYIKGGRERTDKKALDFALECQRLGVGEVLLNSIDSDGNKSGFDIVLNKMISSKLNIPVIASGGAGDVKDFIILAKETNVSAFLAASVFHFNLINMNHLKNDMLINKINVRI